MKHIALILAGGEGSRVNATTPKQFIEVEGESVIAHTLRAFERHPLIDRIYIVCSTKWTAYLKNILERTDLKKVAGIADGGKTGFLSLRNGIQYMIEACEKDENIVLVHDGVRPLVTERVITSNIQVCTEKGNAITALPSNEAFMHTEDGQSSNRFVPRELWMQAQTPHTFSLGTLKKIMKDATAHKVEDSQSLFTLANQLNYTPLFLAEGDRLNFKITTPQDLEIYKALLRADK